MFSKQTGIIKSDWQNFKVTSKQNYFFYNQRTRFLYMMQLMSFFFHDNCNDTNRLSKALIKTCIANSQENFNDITETNETKYQ